MSSKSRSSQLLNLIDFKSLKLMLASPADILSWSFGEVTKPETINYRTLRPEKDGLFDERIFGPSRDWECFCGKYKRIRYRGIICDKCGVEVTQSKVRRERMGHINLAAPAAHVWFFKGAPSKLSLLFDMTPKTIESVIYFASYIVIEVNENKRALALKKLEKTLAAKQKQIEENMDKKINETKELFDKEKNDIRGKITSKESRDMAFKEVELKCREKITVLEASLDAEKQRAKDIFKVLINMVENARQKTLFTEEEYQYLRDYDIADFVKAGMGAEAILEILKKTDLNKLAADLREEIAKTSGQRHIKAAKELRVVESFRSAGINPSGLVLTVLPVIPPDLRPMVQLTGGRFATSDLNDLYRRVINRNNRLKHLMDLGAPEIILRNEKRMLQEAVDSLIDTSQKSNSRIKGVGLRSLSDMLRGKQGRFRQNLLGKRVDYSGRSVIVVGPELSLNQCGLPKEMALEMFKPFVLRELILRGLSPNVKSAKNLLERRPPDIFDILEEITRNHPVLLNRAPTLHKLGIQSFYPILIEGAAIRIHPCVTQGYNADFDGDQMAVHVPLSAAAKKESAELMMPTFNLLKPADGGPITVPNKGMALGCYYLTSIADSEKSDDDLRVYGDFSEAITAYQMGAEKLRTKIKAGYSKGFVITTVGRILFNEVLPEKLRFINENIKAVSIKSIVTKALTVYSYEEVAKMIDLIKDIGFWAETLAGGVSVSLFDIETIAEKNVMIAEAEKQIADYERNYVQGLITLSEKKRLSQDLWIEVTEKIADATQNRLKADNPVRMMMESGGTRASKDQLKQLAAMRGLAVDPLGKIVELPTKSNFRQGLSIFEYVTSIRGSRKGLTDSALKTADAGYLTRRLVDVAHDAIIRIEDCGTNEGATLAGSDPGRTVPFESRILGRTVLKQITDPKSRKPIVKAGEIIGEDKLGDIVRAKIAKVEVRSPLACKSKYGLCALCYGRDFSTRELVELGTPVGVIAAQSIGEPGTQLTMRVKHAGGIVGMDVTQGLPRVEELFEARTPKMLSPISDISGKVEIVKIDEGHKVRIVSKDIKPVQEREYIVPTATELLVAEGDLIAAGDQLCRGFLDIKEVLAVKGLRGAQKYLIDEVQKVYESQGITINDKHFEVIVRKMCDKVQVESAGDTILLPGEFIDKLQFEEENARVLASGGEPAAAQVVLLGITRAALYTSSWLSAASFQHTTQVLTDAASAGVRDMLLGLKENVIIGRLIPTSSQRARIEI